MSKMMQVFTVMLAMVFAGTVSAGVSIDTAETVSTSGNTVVVITATSDAAPISSIGIHIWSDDCLLMQLHPFGVETPFKDTDAIILGGGFFPGDDTHALFSTQNDQMIVVPGVIDSTCEYLANFTGFEPFMSRPIMQVVLAEGNYFDYQIGLISGGDEYTFVSPEPASLGLLALGAMVVMRRR